MNLHAQLTEYRPFNEQEARDKVRMLDFLENGKDVFLRANPTAHFTASAWIVNPARDKVLMVYHRLYRSWSWSGGHADGEENLLAVALREAREETGISRVRPLRETPFSLEIIAVEGHDKRGEYLSSHLHFNVTYLLEADERDPLRIKPDENSGVAWIGTDRLADAVSEPWMWERIYRKLMKKLGEQE